MNYMRALTKLVVGMSRLGDHLLEQKVRGIIVAALAFACGAGLASALKGGPRAAVAVVATRLPAPTRAEVRMRDTDAEEEAERAVFDNGVYENHAYGYSVRIPYGFVGTGAAPPPAPQHGFGIDLDNPRSTAWTRGREFPKSYIYVDGSYNTLEWERLDEAVQSNLDFLREKGRDVKPRWELRTRLGTLPALRAVTDYERDGEWMVSDKVFALSAEEGGGVSVVYTLGLTTPRAKYERDRPVLEELLRGWRLQPVE